MPFVLSEPAWNLFFLHETTDRLLQCFNQYQYLGTNTNQYILINFWFDFMMSVIDSDLSYSQLYFRVSSSAPMRHGLETVGVERELLADQSPAYKINWKMSSSKNKIEIVHVSEAQEFVELLEEHSSLLLGKFLSSSSFLHMYTTHLTNSFPISRWCLQWLVWTMRIDVSLVWCHNGTDRKSNQTL